MFASNWSYLRWNNQAIGIRYQSLRSNKVKGKKDWINHFNCEFRVKRAESNRIIWLTSLLLPWIFLRVILVSFIIAPPYYNRGSPQAQTFKVQFTNNAPSYQVSPSMAYPGISSVSHCPLAPRMSVRHIDIDLFACFLSFNFVFAYYLVNSCLCFA